MSTRNIPGGEGWPARKADNLTAICEPIVYKNVGASTSHSTMDLHGPLQEYLYLSYLNAKVGREDIFKPTIVGYRCYQLHTKFYPIFFSQG
jgi:hypothetical protein